MNDIVISLENISKYYKLYKSPKDRLKEALHPFGKHFHTKFYAVNDLSIEIKRGEIVGIVGNNGAGKSTLLKLISGILVPSAGKFKVSGRVSALLELGAGFNPEFTGLDNIYFYGSVNGYSKSEMERKIEEICHFADLGEYIHQPVKSYSTGMKARLGFAAAVNIEPEILILDEVLAVGDILFQKKCYAKINNMLSSGTTVIYVSHNMNSVNTLCSRAIFIEAGRVFLAGKPSIVTKYYEKYMHTKDSMKKHVLEEISELNKEIIINHGNYEECTPLNGSSSKLDKAKTEYRNYDVDIFDQEILDLNNVPVNVLNFGERYRFCVKYKSNVKFKIENVSFGVDFKTINGNKVSSVESTLLNKNGYTLDSLTFNERLNVEFTFDCFLPFGMYFVNIGLSMFDGDDQVILNRVIDGYSFRVMDIKDRVVSGSNYIFQKVSINNEIWKI